MERMAENDKLSRVCLETGEQSPKSTTNLLRNS